MVDDRPITFLAHADVAKYIELLSEQADCEADLAERFFNRCITSWFDNNAEVVLNGSRTRFRDLQGNQQDAIYSYLIAERHRTVIDMDLWLAVQRNAYRSIRGATARYLMLYASKFGSPLIVDGTSIIVVRARRQPAIKSSAADSATDKYLTFMAWPDVAIYLELLDETQRSRFINDCVFWKFKNEAELILNDHIYYYVEMSEPERNTVYGYLTDDAYHRSDVDTELWLAAQSNAADNIWHHTISYLVLHAAKYGAPMNLRGTRRNHPE